MIHLKNILQIVIPLGLIIACTSNEEVSMITPPIKVETALVKEQEITLPVHAVGKVYAKEELKMAFKTGGIIKDILVDEGQQVKKGQILAELNLSEIEARLNQSQLGFEKAQRDYERAYNLYQDSVVTLEQLENVQTQLDFSYSEMEIAEFNYKYSRIVAPENGRILKRLAEETEMINPGSPVFLFGSNAVDWVVRANISEGDIFRIATADEARLSLDAYPDKTIMGKVTEIGNSADPYTGTYEIEITITGKELKLASGLFARFDVYPVSKQLYDVIPINALVEANEKEGFVYMVTDTNSIERKKVNIQRIKNDVLYVQSDLNQGDVIVTTGASYINSKSKIEITNSPLRMAMKSDKQ